MNTSACGRKIKIDIEKFKDGPIYRDFQRMIKDGSDKQNFTIKITLAKNGHVPNREYMQLQKKQLGLLNQKEETTGLMRIAIKLFKR